MRNNSYTRKYFFLVVSVTFTIVSCQARDELFLNEEILKNFDARSDSSDRSWTQAPPPPSAKSCILCQLFPGADPLDAKLSKLEMNIKLHPFPNYERLLKKLNEWKRSKREMQIKLEKILSKYSYQLSRLVISKPATISGQKTCGRAAEEALYVEGGNDTTIERYPWMVQLLVARDRFTTPDPKFDLARCGATIVSSEWLLTAAHCVPPENELLITLRSLVSKDELKSYFTEEKHVDRVGAIVGVSMTTENAEQVIPFKEIVRRKSFEKNNLNKNDVALIRLEKPLDLSSRYIRAICLPDESELHRIHSFPTKCTVAGWGLTDTNPDAYPKTLQSANVLIKDLSACNKTYQNLYTKNAATGELMKMYVPEGHLCAGGPTGVPDACIGDSGGPLMCVSPKTGKLVPTGIVSFGPDAAHVKKDDLCGTYPGVYTDLRPHLSWLKSKLLSEA